MVEPEEKKAVPESDDPADRRRLLDRRSGVTDRRIKPDRRASLTDNTSDNSKDRRARPDRRSGVLDRRLNPSKRRTVIDDISDYRNRGITDTKPEKKWYEKLFPSKTEDS